MPRPIEGKAISDLKHSPFAALAKQRDLLGKSPQNPAGVVVRSTASTPSKPPPALKVRVNLEPSGRSGKLLTRLTGLPAENIDAIASRLSRALGCTANVQGGDIVLPGTLDQRAQQWLEQVGDLRKIAKAQQAPTSPASTGQNATTTAQSSMLSGKRRADVRRGRRVAIVQKADQETGNLTRGVVRDVLTNSETHPRGIKVRLETGEVGRVQVIYE